MLWLQCSSHLPGAHRTDTPCCRRTEAIREAVRCLRAMVQLRGSNGWHLGRKNSTGWINLGSPFPQTSTNYNQTTYRIYTMWIQKNSAHVGQLSTCFLLYQHNDQMKPHGRLMCTSQQIAPSSLSDLSGHRTICTSGESRVSRRIP